MTVSSLRIRWLAVLAIAVVLGALDRQSRTHAGTNGYSDRHVNAGSDGNGDTDACTHARKRQYAGAGGNSDHDPGEHPNAGADCNGGTDAYSTHARKRQYAGAGGNSDHDPGEHPNAGADCNGGADAYTTYARKFIVSA